MTARSKALTIVEPIDAPVNTKAVKFEKPAPRSAVHLISSDNLDELIDLLHNEGDLRLLSVDFKLQIKSKTLVKISKSKIVNFKSKILCQY
jgi:hypothetical protein